MRTGDPVGVPGGVERPPPLLFHRVPADPDRLTEIRHAVNDWAVLAGLPEDDRTDLVLVTYEAMALVLEHRDRQDGQAGPVSLRIEPSIDDVTVTVIDHRPWRQPLADCADHRGLLVINGIAPHFEHCHIDEGTAIRMRWPLARP